MTRVLAPLFSASAAPSPLALPAQDLLRDRLADLQARRVECGTSDFSSLARGKLVHAQDVIGQRGCKMPSVVLGLTLTAGEPEAVFGPLLPASYADVHLVPDLSTLSARPGRPGEATVICEPAGLLQGEDGRSLEVASLSPRAALRAVLAGLAADGLQALVAPELELFLLQRDGAELLAARALPGSHAREQACEAYSLERSGHFQAYFDALFTACEALGIPVSGHAHESALSQYEVNFHPGPPLAQADAVFRFKRLAREIAVQQGFLASFAAKPFLDQPGTGMHWHASLQRVGDSGGGWPHLFARADGSDSPALGHFVAGQQAEAAASMAFYAPYDMSYDRIRLSDAAPTHASWGHEARSLAFRVPSSGPSARRVENRLPGGDANPYLTVAATLGLGGQGLRAARAPLQGADALALPASLPEALSALQASAALRQLMGDALVEAYVAIKRHEHAERQALADPRAQWDLRHLIELA